MTDLNEKLLFKRINRELAGKHKRLCVLRGQHYSEYYIVNAHNSVVAQHCDLEKLALALGLLENGEAIQPA
jgi:hypothetical protein